MYSDKNIASDVYSQYKPPTFSASYAVNSMGTGVNMFPTVLPATPTDVLQRHDMMTVILTQLNESCLTVGGNYLVNAFMPILFPFSVVSTVKWMGVRHSRP